MEKSPSENRIENRTDGFVMFSISPHKTIRVSAVLQQRVVITMIQQSSETVHIPDFLRRFFWEYDPRKLEVERHADVIMGRIMERGDWDAMCWLRQTYPMERLRRFLEMRGQRILPPRELNYWALICDISG